MKKLWKTTGLGVLGALCLASAATGQESAAPGRRYLILLHEDGRYQNAAGSAVAGRIAEYARWSRETPGIESGDKLSDEAWSLSGSNAAKAPVQSKKGFVAGLFVLRAGTDAEAIRIAQSCPHLRYGGTIELRPIE